MIVCSTKFELFQLQARNLQILETTKLSLFLGFEKKKGKPGKINGHFDFFRGNVNSATETSNLETFGWKGPKHGTIFQKTKAGPIPRALT